MKKSLLYPLLLLAAFAAALSACSDHKSYAEQLNEETQTVNAFLARHRVVDEMPTDTNYVFEVGPNAPYYRLDEERNVYMQVLYEGKEGYAEKGDRVYFRYLRYNLNNYVIGGDDNVGAGNANNLGTSPSFILFETYDVQESAAYGTGIQMPLKFLQMGSRVNLVVKSQAGAYEEIQYVVPYLYEIRYNKPVL